MADLLGLQRLAPRRLPLGSGARIALACSALVLNAASPPAIGAALAGLALLLWLVDGARAAHLRGLALALGTGLLLLAGGAVAGLPHASLLALATRLGAGACWLGWLGATCRWTEVRAALDGSGATVVAELTEQALVLGQTLSSEFQRSRLCAVVRAGRSPSWATWGTLLAGTLERGLSMGVALDQVRALRSAAANPPTPGPGPALWLQGACLTGRLPVIDLRVEAGERVVLAGASGSGKSTLLQLCAGLLPSSAGVLERLGRPVGRGPLSQRVDGEVALVFQDPDDQLLGASAVEDVAWGLLQRRVPRPHAESQARSALAALGLSHLAGRPVHEASFGERKRLAFAGALVLKPRLLLCDEPTMGLDPLAAARLVTLLDSLAGPATAVVWATHDLATVPRTARRLVLLGSRGVHFDGALTVGRQAHVLRQVGLLPSEEGP